MCEEAHAYIPRAGDSQFEGSRKSMERIAKEGRKYGVGLAVVSQRPRDGIIVGMAPPQLMWRTAPTTGIKG